MSAADQSRDARVPLGTPTSPNISEGLEGTPASRPLADAINAVRGELGEHAAKQLSRITGQDAKTAQRQMASGRPPSGPAVFLMATDPNIGPAFLVRGARRLAPEDHKKFWNGMALAALSELRPLKREATK